MDGSEERLGWNDILKFWDDLHATAHRLLERERGRCSLQTTALVLTALRSQKERGWETGFDEVKVEWENRRHFFGQMINAMRQKIVEEFRKKKRVRQLKIVPLDRFDPEDFRQRCGKESAYLLALGEALTELQKIHPEWVTLIEYRFILGMTQAEAAAQLDIVPRTAERWWKCARVELVRKINRILEI